MYFMYKNAMLSFKTHFCKYSFSIFTFSFLPGNCLLLSSRLKNSATLFAICFLTNGCRGTHFFEPLLVDFRVMIVLLFRCHFNLYFFIILPDNIFAITFRPFFPLSFLALLTTSAIAFPSNYILRTFRDTFLDVTLASLKSSPTLFLSVLLF